MSLSAQLKKHDQSLYGPLLLSNLIPVSFRLAQPTLGLLLMSTPSLTTTVVVLPTYNEIANFRNIAMESLSLSPSSRPLFVDDASPDGTGEEAERLAASSRHVTVIRRGGKLGLGSAYRQAFQMILKESHPAPILQKDAAFF